ncbi:MAG: hypothetical protein QM785_08645 [Pyrinomonadaceae bacterium]
MIKSFLSTLVVFGVLITANQLVFSQTGSIAVSQKDSERIAKVKKDTAKIGVGKAITVSRLDNRDFFGTVRTIGTDDFEVIETDSGQIQIFKYVDIKNVRSGDGKISPITGKRGNSRTKKILGFVAVGVLATIIVVVVKGLNDPNF